MDPPAKRQKQENIQEPSSKSILDLNNECIIEIFSYFSIRELVEVDKVCPHFRNIADAFFYKKKKVLKIEMDSYSQENVAELAERVGPHVDTLKVFCYYDELEFEYSITEYFQALWNHCTNIEYLITQDAKIWINLLLLQNTFKTLKKVHLNNCYPTDEIGEYLRNASKLESLCLETIFEFPDWFLSDLKDQLKELVLIRSSSIYQYPDFGQFCRHNRRLESLTFECGRSTPASIMEHLDQLKHLRKLIIDEAGHGPASRIVPDLPQLKHLEISTRWFSDCSHLRNFLSRLGDTDTLEYLRFFAVSGLDFNRILPKFTKLKVLKMLHCNLKDFQLSAFNIKCRMTLEDLHINKSSEVTDEQLLQFLKDCPNLKILNITGLKNVTDSFIIGLLPILKGRLSCLEIFVGQTGINRSIEENLKLHEHQHIKLHWKTCYF